MQRDAWQFNDQNATGEVAGQNLEFDPGNPSQGLVIERPAGRWQILAVEPKPGHSLVVSEAYVRGQDLIVRYEQGEDDPFAFQINYRILDDSQDGVSGVEMWLSVQTRDLDAHPIVEVACRADGAPCEWVAYDAASLGVAADSDCNAAIQAIQAQAAGIWMIDARDLNNTQSVEPLQPDERRLELFGHFMEKGVIRRARMRFHLSDERQESASVAELYKAFVSSPLPLTA